MFVTNIVRSTSVLMASLLVAVFGSFLITSPVFAACAAGQQELSIAIQDPNDPTKTTNCIQKDSTNLLANPIVAVLKTIVQFLAVGIGLGVVGGLTAGGVLYMSARGNSNQVQKAEETIRNSIIGLVLYIFLFTVVNFLIPGGILN